MEKNGYKVIAVVALIIAVVALSVGFASFSATLSIQNAQATIQPGNVTLDVHFVPNTDPSNPSIVCTGTGTATATVGSITGTNNVQWGGLSASLKRGETVTCTAEITNASVYAANLKSIQFVAPSGGVNTLACNSTNANIQNMSAACGAITVTVKPDTTWVSSSAPTATVTSSTPTPVTNISSVSIAAGATQKISVEIAYGGAATDVADDTFTVTIPTVELNFDTQ